MICRFFDKLEIGLQARTKHSTKIKQQQQERTATTGTKEKNKMHKSSSEFKDTKYN